MAAHLCRRCRLPIDAPGHDRGCVWHGRTTHANEPRDLPDMHRCRWCGIYFIETGELEDVECSRSANGYHQREGVA